MDPNTLVFIGLAELVIVRSVYLALMGALSRTSEQQAFCSRNRYENIVAQHQRNSFRPSIFAKLLSSAVQEQLHLHNMKESSLGAGWMLKCDTAEGVLLEDDKFVYITVTLSN